MSQVLSFKIEKNHYDQKTLTDFISQIELDHSVERLDENCYEIISSTGKKSIYQLAEDEVYLEGYIDDDTYQEFEKMADYFNAVLLLEGEPIGETEINENDKPSIFQVIIAIIAMILLVLFGFFAAIISLILLPIKKLYQIIKK